MVFGKIAAINRGENADRTQQMFVDRIVMIHVELHHGDDFAEFRNEAPKHTCFIHHAQDDFGLAALSEYLEENGVGLWIRADRFT